MKLLYVTDLHGSMAKYDQVLEIARKEQVDLVINGGDMLPTDRDLFRQDEFIHRYLEGHFGAYDASGIWYLCFLGNDDLRVFDAVLDRVCAPFPRVLNTAQRKAEVNGYEFIGMNWVVDYPFRCKDRCRMDTCSYKFQEQYGTGLLSTNAGWQELPDWPGYAAGLRTIEEELEQLPRPVAMERAIYVIHMPPAGIGLDVIGDGRAVGSAAVAKFLRSEQPLLSLHGHIHESPAVSGAWKGNIGRTVCIQPGMDPERLVYTMIDLAGMAFKRCRR